MQMLAKKSCVATGSIYNYFENKEKLINDIFRQICDEENAFVVEGYDDTQPVKARFEYLLRRSLEFKINNPAKFQFKSLYTFSPVIMKELLENDVPEGYPFGTLMLDGQAQGLIKPLRLEELFYFAHGGLSSLLRWKQFENQSVNQEDINRLVALTWDAIKC